jgi:hypothetical protein
MVEAIMLFAQLSHDVWLPYVSESTFVIVLIAFVACVLGFIKEGI